MDRDVRLIAPVPAFAPDQVVITREEFATMWDARSTLDAEPPSFGWLDALKGRVDVHTVVEA
ncbi:hypothetical protein AO398_00480 [Methylobacterium sp. GXS13]|uniref:hypothetical protein n=1 Tax=Methylobacterium sp. GXS13 TaxID=1730094 RepID=UPI00071B39A1|nr:hypothetical protein [Methylobacterium sp. GXS13]KST61201.1 hypothetical protein AO398_00480 [Methylobacterium sp. GXS13]